MLNLRIDHVSYKSKPSKGEMAAVSRRLSETNSQDLDWDTFCRLVGEKGHSFCVSDFYGTRKKENFKCRQIFALDFDKDAKYRDILLRAESCGIPAALAYETLSSKVGERFRIVFVNAFPIFDIRVSEIVTDALMTIFPECDPSCRDCSRIFLGGKRIIVSSEETLSLSRLMMELPRCLRGVHGEKHYKKHVEKFTLKHNLERCGGFAFLGAKQSEDYFSFTENGTEYFFNFAGNRTPSNRKANREKTRHFRFEVLREKCRLFDEFVSDSEWLYHDELFGIACNLNNIGGGKRIFLEAVENSRFDPYREKDWNYYFNYMNAQEYRPMDCDKFCPYADCCKHAANMVLTAKTNRSHIVKLQEKEYCSLEEASADLEEKLNAVMASTQNQIYIIKAQTAIGKTHHYIKMIKNSDKKFIIAVPTNLLKDEVYDRLLHEGVTDAVKTESVATLERLDNEIGDKVKELNALGAHYDLVRYLKKQAKAGKEYLLDYIKPLSEYKARVIVTTHKKFLHAKEEFLKGYEIIIDEDILLSAVKNTTAVLLEDVRKLKKYRKVQDFLGKIRNNEEYISMESCSDYVCYNTIRKKNISSNVNAFMKATAIQVSGKYLNCFVPTAFHNLKYTILSATASEEVYKLYFKNRAVHCIRCKEARYLGKLIQDCSRSFSRRDIDSDENFFERILRENPEAKYIITFLKYKKEAQNCVIHYGNTEGCDYMKGENLVVAGTPHYNESVYKLFAAHLGIDANVKMRFAEVTDSCCKYWLNTYDEPRLRSIQLWLLKSELIQAVGRARLLRFDCTVKLYASIPLAQAEIVSG